MYMHVVLVTAGLSRIPLQHTGRRQFFVSSLIMFSLLQFYLKMKTTEKIYFGKKENRWGGGGDGAYNG